MYVGDFGVYPLYRTPPPSDPSAPPRKYWPTNCWKPLLGDKWPAGNLTFNVAFGSGVPSPQRGISRVQAITKFEGSTRGMTLSTGGLSLMVLTVTMLPMTLRLSRAGERFGLLASELL